MGKQRTEQESLARKVAVLFGRRVRSLRGEETQRSLAHRCMLSAEMISAIERGKSQPTLATMLSLQEAFNLPTLEHLIGPMPEATMPSKELMNRARGL